MSMQKQLSVRDDCRPITALGYHPARREVLTGCADGVIKWWDIESGRRTASSTKEHSGMITHFLYWSESKLLLSASNDGTVVAWTIGATVLEKILLGRPVFSMAINHRRHQLVCGFAGRVTVYPLDEKKGISTAKSSSDHRHSDIVSCIVCHDSQVYTAGYDRKLIIFDTSSYPNVKGLTAVHCISRAHEAGITALALVKEKESTRLLTGSFDKTVRVWSQDGQLIQRISFSGVITGLCYVPCVSMLWIASEMPVATLYDPKSGEIVSDFIDTFQNTEGGPNLERLVYVPETSSVIGSAGQRHVTVWRYNKTGCVTVLKNRQPTECLAYTKKKPILLFSGHGDGTLLKWERFNSSHFLYSKELFNVFETPPQGRERRTSSRADSSTVSDEMKRRGTSARRCTRSNESVPPAPGGKTAGFTRSVFVEELDLLALSSENGSVYLWGFDDSLSSLLRMMPSKTNIDSDPAKRFELMSDRAGGSRDSNMTEEEHVSDSVTNRVSGFICKKVLAGHFHTVSGLAVVGKGSIYSTVYLISGGWDRRLCIWDLKTGELQDTFCNPDLNGWHELKEVACDGIILDLAYSPKRNEFAYSSSDGLIYIRQFSPVGQEMRLVNVLQGHQADITAIVWHHLSDKWISGSEDGSIRIWTADGMQCERTLATNGAVSCLSVDELNGCIIAGVHNVLRVYDPESYLLVQRNAGHTDSIRSVLHIPERKQYVTASSDMTIRMWNSYTMIPPNTQQS
ncbi:uncharacterized WD repeat-containing protein alr3466-like [Polyodon spathula]|uniref:uncharacterized WD repeat-containing protein alr3466-like n=1 Tax=Polyodon spathula TaxID=7913 RepID=UPI001B7F74C4|nr:uncharacterized WD repeat-containing protein alr3466-like [Polyodon spathula]